MSRAVRMVPATWQHPVDKHGDPIPMHASFPYNAAEIAAGAVEVEAFGVSVLLGLVQDIIANASTAAYENLADQRRRTTMGKQLAKLDELLSNAERVYVVTREKADA